jgi:transcriptional regulator with XRE-family HTH domain
MGGIDMKDGKIKGADKRKDNINAIEFGRRLRRKIAESGFTHADIIRRARALLPEGSGVKIDKSSMSLYVNGKVIPRAAPLQAIAAALGCSPEDLLEIRTPGRPMTIEHVDPEKDLYIVDIRTTVDWETLVKLREVLKGTK